MRLPIVVALAALAFSPQVTGLSAYAQTITLPAEVKVQPGRLAALAVDYDGDELRYDVPPDLDCFREYDADPKKVRLRILGTTPGKYRLIAVCVKGGKLSDFKSTTIVVGDPVPPPVPVPPTPTPVPPGPGPQPPAPTPTPAVAPIAGAGLKVLIVFDASMQQTLGEGHLAAIYGDRLRAYLQEKCPVGEDGKTKEFRIYPNTVNCTNESKVWRDAFARKRDALPWLVVSGGGAKGGFEGPLPATLDETMAIIQKYEDK